MKNKWGIQWHSECRLDGVTKEFLWDNGTPLVFRTREDARYYIRNEYGYIKTRPDLRAEPHGWRMPKAVKVRVKLEEA